MNGSSRRGLAWAGIAAAVAIGIFLVFGQGGSDEVSATGKGGSGGGLSGGGKGEGGIATTGTGNGI